MYKFIKFLFSRQYLLFVFFCLNTLVSMEIEDGNVTERRSAAGTSTNNQWFNIDYAGCGERLGQMCNAVNFSGCRNRFVQGATYVCELGAEIIVSVAVVGGSLAIISVASSLQAQGEEQGAHYETRHRTVCTDDDTKGYHCNRQSYTECYGPYEACQKLDAASTLFAIGGVGILGTGAFWGYKIYNNFERYCLGRRD